ncbi:unnamed protein product [marine sediment metagenome]|uniref:Methyltransferase domain-containing protein n=1 Tax=marine sediment metagenome TaxID=412755 RepID=X1IRS6_9ZZZZ
MSEDVIQEIKEMVERVDGWLSDKEGVLLYNLARSCKGRGVIVEIGSWHGKSTIWLGKGSQAGSQLKVYAIDPHIGVFEHRKIYGEAGTFPGFMRNIKKAKVDDVVIPIVKTSEEAARNFTEPVELVFIDGVHEYKFVSLDFELWFPKLVSGGIIAFHDAIGFPGPRRVVTENLHRFTDIGYVDEIAFAQK